MVRRSDSKAMWWAPLRCARIAAAFAALLLATIDTQAREVWVCSVPSAYPCTGSVITLDESLVDGHGVGSCVGAAIVPGASWDACGVGAGVYAYRDPDELTADDWVLLANETFDAADTFTFGTEDPDPDPEPEPGEVDLQEAATYFGAAFSLAFVFWAMGKGVAIVIALIRRG